MKKQQLVTKALSLPANAIFYSISQELASIYPNKKLMVSSDSAFNLENYVKANLCTIEYNHLIYNQIATGWNGKENKIYNYNINASFQVTWQGSKLDVLLITLQLGFSITQHYWILADSKEVAEDFFVAVCYWNSEIKKEVVVFENGYWQKNADLFQSIQGATFANLILHGTLKQDIQDDLTDFFADQQIYADYGVIWKRGILFTGSPGNGKTHTVKALINQIQQPCLYVKSFKSQNQTDSGNIRQVFEKARQSAPCILVLEDIDSLLTDGNRSFFLNELDGFAMNQGIVTIGTTNHPESLDSSITNRPSRFDRIYTFPLPEILERKAYMTLWDNKFKPAMRLSDSEFDEISALTEGFSFAYLKELFLSSMIRWMKEREVGAMKKIMLSQIATLREQMSSVTVA